MLQVLHAVGSSSHRQEAEALCAHLLPSIPVHLRPRFLDSGPVRWAAPRLGASSTPLGGGLGRAVLSSWRDRMQVGSRAESGELAGEQSFAMGPRIE